MQDLAIGKKERVVSTEGVTSVPLRQEAAPVRKAKPVPKPPVPTLCPVVHRAHAPRGKHGQAVYSLPGMRPQAEQTPVRKHSLVSQMPPPVLEGLVHTPFAGRTPRTRKYKEKCVQHLGDRLTAL